MGSKIAIVILDLSLPWIAHLLLLKIRTKFKRYFSEMDRIMVVSVRWGSRWWQPLCQPCSGRNIAVVHLRMQDARSLFDDISKLELLIPRKDLSSDAFSLVDHDYESLIRATQTVSDLIQPIFNKYHDEISEGGCECHGAGTIFEGYEIDRYINFYPMITRTTFRRFGRKSFRRQYET